MGFNTRKLDVKCPECSKSHKFKYGMRCACGYEFAPDPKRHKMADARFLAIVLAASN